MSALTWRPMCPWCGTRDVQPSPGFLETADREQIATTHACTRCERRFRVVPPSQQAVQSYNAAHA